MPAKCITGDGAVGHAGEWFSERVFRVPWTAAARNRKVKGYTRKFQSKYCQRTFERRVWLGHACGDSWIKRHPRQFSDAILITFVCILTTSHSRYRTTFINVSVSPISAERATWTCGLIQMTIWYWVSSPQFFFFFFMSTKSSPRVSPIDGLESLRRELSPTSNVYFILQTVQIVERLQLTPGWESYSPPPAISCSLCVWCLGHVVLAERKSSGNGQVFPRTLGRKVKKKYCTNRWPGLYYTPILQTPV